MEIWDPLCSYFTSHPDVGKPSEVRTIQGLLHHPLTKARLLFLSNILLIFDKFNVYFQMSSTAAIQKLLRESKQLLQKVLSFFVEPEVILAVAVTEEVCNDPRCVLANKEVSVGDKTSTYRIHSKNSSF